MATAFENIKAAQLQKIAFIHTFPLAQLVKVTNTGIVYISSTWFILSCYGHGTSENLGSPSYRKNHFQKDSNGQLGEAGNLPFCEHTRQKPDDIAAMHYCKA